MEHNSKGRIIFWNAFGIFIRRDTGLNVQYGTARQIGTDVVVIG